MKKKYIHIVIITLFFTPVSLLFCYTYILNTFQDKPSDNYNFRIEFVRSISSSDDLMKEKGIGEEIFDWIFGSDFFTLVKPVGIINNNDEMIVLDQGRRELVIIDTTGEEFIPIEAEDNMFFPSLLGICRIPNNNFLFTDSKNNTIYLLDSEKGEIKLLNNKLELNQPTGIAINKKTSEIWVVETKNHSITVLDSSGNIIKKIGTRGTKPGEFNFPTFIWIDNDGIVYVIDSMNFRIQILNKDGDVLNTFGEAGDATGYFARPKGVAVDSYGHIYIVDGLYNSVQVFDSKGNFLYYFGTKGAGNGEFWLPTGIYIDENDFIYVADSYNSRIQIFQLLKNEN